MKIIVFALFAVAALSLAHSNTFYKAQFGAYVSKYNKSYSEQEYRYRLSVFAENLDLINSENAKGHPYKLGFTRFSDMTNDEFKASKFCGCLMTPNNLRNSKIVSMNVKDIPESVDWREKGAVNPIRDQGSCGACWAFSAVAAMEGAIAIKTGTLYRLSEQQLVDCDPKSSGCGGGWMDYAFDYVAKHGGICSEDDYPYTAKKGECKDSQCKSVATITSYGSVPSKDGKQLLAALANQPVSVAIAGSSYVFQHYTSGVIDGSACGTYLNHGVTAVGYGIEEDKKYILVRNSWGPDWGLEGYVKIAHNDTGYGICGINRQPYFPIA